MSKRRIGVLVMSYGTPESLDQIAAYYTHIRRGSPPSAEQLQDLQHRYEAIAGGFFPLRENTNRQVEALEKTLNKYSNLEAGSTPNFKSTSNFEAISTFNHNSSSSSRASHPAPASSDTEIKFVCYQGLKHAFPFIEDGVRQMVEDGIEEAVGVVLAPHYSVMSVGGYITRAQSTAQELGLPIKFVHSYHLHPKLIETLSTRVEKALLKFIPIHYQVKKTPIQVIFSAHSLPASIIEMKDPYAQQLLETSQAIADRTGITRWTFAWQSAGRTATPWLGPDILEVLRNLHLEHHADQVLICPIGFVSDHLEVLYDIDIECQAAAAKLGMHLERTESLNTDPKYMEVLRDVIMAKLS